MTSYISSLKKIRRPQVWQIIRENIYTHRKPKVQHEDEVMVCHCELTADGGPACGPDCLNRVLNMECVPVSFNSVLMLRYLQHAYHACVCLAEALFLLITSRAFYS